MSSFLEPSIIFTSNSHKIKRVNLTQMQNESEQRFKILHGMKANEFDMVNPTAKQIQHSLLSHTFFSEGNMQILQNAIRKGVFEMSKGKYMIGEQNRGELRAVMTTKYLQHARHLPDHITEQVADLNRVVLQHCVPNVYKTAKFQLEYLKRIDTLPVPPSMPQVEYDEDRKTHKMRSFL